MLNFAVNHSKRNREDILVLSADGFINQTIVTKTFNLPNCHFVADKWHLLDSVLPKRFGITIFASLRGFIIKMMYAEKKEGFEETYSSHARSFLQSLSYRDKSYEGELEKFAS
jgi:hypothetical protein